MAEKILIVDDDLESLKLIGLMLQRRGYQIAAAQGGAQALSKAESEQPDLIILDIMMPDMDGYEVTRRMRANQKTADIPIIMFTAKTMVGDKVAGFQAGADDYLTKPIHPAELSSRVEAVLLRRARTRAEMSVRPHARILGFIGAKGGVGTTTLAINVAVALAQGSKDDASQHVILGDLHSAAGDVGLQLGISRASGLQSLVSRQADDVSAKHVESALTGHVSGMRMLLSPIEQRAETTDLPARHADAIIRQLASLAEVVVLDLGSRLDDGARAAVRLCSRLIVVLEPQRPAVLLAQSMLAQLEKAGIGADKVMPVVVHRSPSAATLSKAVIEGILNRDLAVVVTPVPEAAFQASEQGAPLIMVQPGNIVSDQFRELARILMLGPI